MNDSDTCCFNWTLALSCINWIIQKVKMFSISRYILPILTNELQSLHKCNHKCLRFTEKPAYYFNIWYSPRSIFRGSWNQTVLFLCGHGKLLQLHQAAWWPERVPLLRLHVRLRRLQWCWCENDFSSSPSTDFSNAGSSPPNVSLSCWWWLIDQLVTWLGHLFLVKWT